MIEIERKGARKGEFEGLMKSVDRVLSIDPPIIPMCYPGVTHLTQSDMAEAHKKIEESGRYIVVDFNAAGTESRTRECVLFMRADLAGAYKSR